MSHSVPSLPRSRHLPLCAWPRVSCRCIASPNSPNSSTDSLCAARLVSWLELCRVAACRHMSPYGMDAVFRPHDGADSFHCLHDPSLLLRVRAKYLVRTRALIPACRFSVVPVVLWSCRAYMFLTRAKYSAYLLSASSLAVGLLLSFVCVPWEPDPSLEPMGVLHRTGGSPKLPTCP